MTALGVKALLILYLYSRVQAIALPWEPGEYQLFQQRIIVLFEDSFSGSQGLIEAMQEKLKQFDAH
ncbi:hypothetical protein [Thiofilum flexile]|uniref:hypothetical protein n=1 Tax=Thiofilum flexile TaxID=125627 RepID=UPI00039D4F85|nr:hypothetical protein [Thiofilum flexile]